MKIIACVAGGFVGERTRERIPRNFVKGMAMRIIALFIVSIETYRPTKLLNKGGKSHSKCLQEALNDCVVLNFISLIKEINFKGGIHYKTRNL